jgi:hypothetical protein
VTLRGYTDYTDYTEKNGFFIKNPCISVKSVKSVFERFLITAIPRDPQFGFGLLLPYRVIIPPAL